jgi:hypothetical protein
VKVNYKSLPFWVVISLGSIEIIFMNDSLVSFFSKFSWWFFYGAILQIAWAYWKGKDMLAPPNFDFKNGANETPRFIFVIAMLGCLVIMVAAS